MEEVSRADVGRPCSRWRREGVVGGEGERGEESSMELERRP